MSTKHAVTGDLAILKLRVNALRLQFIDYQRTKDAQDDMENLRLRDNSGSEGAVLKLIGESRSGKTKIISDFVSRFPMVPKAQRLENGVFADLREVVCIRVPDTNVKNLLERLLAELSNRTVEQVTSRGFNRFTVQDQVLHYAKLLGLKLLILEEAHQGIDGKNDNAANTFASVLKDMTNERGFSLVVAGTAIANRLFEVNPELDGRTIYRHELSPLSWDVDDERQWFVKVLTGLDEYLRDEVFGKLSGLATDPIAQALLKAGRGQIGHAATLLESAAIYAVEDVKNRANGLTVNHLAKALSKSPLGQYTPDAFVELGFPVETIAGPQPVPTGIKGRTHRSARDVAFRP